MVVVVLDARAVGGDAWAVRSGCRGRAVKGWRITCEDPYIHGIRDHRWCVVILLLLLLLLGLARRFGSGRPAMTPAALPSVAQVRGMSMMCSMRFTTAAV